MILGKYLLDLAENVGLARRLSIPIERFFKEYLPKCPEWFIIKSRTSCRGIPAARSEKQKGAVFMVVFLQSRLGLAVSAAFAFLSILMRWMVSRRYSWIARQAERMDTTKDKTLKNWKIQFEELAGIRKGVTNIPAFVDKCLKKYRRWGITLKKWNGMADGLVLFSLFSGLVLAFGAYWYELDYRLMILYGSGGVIFGGVALLTGNILDPAGRRELARLALLDYLENTLLPDLEGRPGRSRRRVQPLQSPKLTLEPEEEAVLKDVFSEYLT